MANVSGSRQPEREMVRLATVLLSRLLDTPESVFFSNKSLIVLIEALGGRLMAAIDRGEEYELLRAWEAQLPAFSQRLLALARQDKIRMPDGSTRHVMSETKTTALLDECPPGPDELAVLERVTVRG